MAAFLEVDYLDESNEATAWELVSFEIFNSRYLT
jgi:hypothetical protein